MVPENVKPSIPEVVKDFSEYYEKHPVWGSLHIVLADGNVRDADVKLCLDWAKATIDADGVRLAEILLKMSKTQRLKLSDAVHRYNQMKVKEFLKW